MPQARSGDAWRHLLKGDARKTETTRPLLIGRRAGDADRHRSQLGDVSAHGHIGADGDAVNVPGRPVCKPGLPYGAET